LIEHVSVVRGNIVAVDHGRSLKQDLGKVPIGENIECCAGEEMPGDVILQAADFRPKLSEGPLTYCQATGKKQSASGFPTQDPRQALAHINLTETSPDAHPSHWQPVRDLLAAGPDSRQFVAEVDESGIAELRFGNGRSGLRPEAESLFTTCYRVGNGKAGNVGAETIIHMIVSSGLISGGIIRIRNPMAARGGIDPEPQSEVKLFAPKAFRTEIQRAITAEDYVQLVEREFKGRVQRAAATICWVGCGHLVQIAIDPLGQEQASPELLAEIQGRLYRYRRIGHDLLVQSACRVPLDIQLTVCVKPDYLRAHVKVSLLDVFSNRNYGNGLKGFFHPDNLTFGDDIYLGKLSAITQKVAGVQSVSVSRLQRCFEPANGELENGVMVLSPLEIARLDNNPSLPANGKLALIMGGGR
jgi:predicted phage baseplate assembly protein